MRLHWEVDDADIERVRAVVAAKAKSQLLIDRVAQKRSNSISPVERARFWNKLVGCMLSSAQRSGPDAPIAKFQRLNPFPLRLEVCEARCDLSVIAQERLKGFGGIASSKRIPKQLCTNVLLMKGKAWAACAEELERLQMERDA